MTPDVEKLLTLADRDLAAGRYADAEKEYAKALELDPDCYVAVHGRGAARTWQSTLLSGDPTALIYSTQDAFAMAERAGADTGDFLARVAVDLINLTSNKYNELTRIYTSIARKENTKAPSPLFFYTWDLSHPQGLTLPDVYIPMINYLAALIQVSEYLDGVLEGNEALKRRRQHNIGNLNIFYDWLIAFNATGRVAEGYYNQILEKKQQLLTVRSRLDKELSEPEYRNVPSARPEGRPLPGVSSDVDREEKVAHFGERPPIEIICPICGTIQKSNRSVCFQCSCQFIFDDEQ